MAKEKEETWFDRLRKKVRLVAMDPTQFNEKWSILISPWNMIVVAVGGGLLLIIGTYVLIAYTGLKETLPGYPDGTDKEMLVEMQRDLSEAKMAVSRYDKYTRNLQMILAGNDTTYKRAEQDTARAADFDPDTIQFAQSPTDSAFREMVEEGNSYDFYSPNLVEGSGNQSTMMGVFFFTPLNGTISQSFDEKAGHYGVDIVAPEKEAIKATLDGKVILATWTSDAGHTIFIQHSNNLVSVYKHNSLLMKRAGDEVKAGEPIAVIGNTGELTTGAHLQFELWQNGRPLDPQEYITF